jgi:hypothetical protein
LHKSSEMVLFAEDSRERIMSERRIGQLSFRDGLVSDAVWANAALQRVSERVDRQPRLS